MDASTRALHIQELLEHVIEFNWDDREALSQACLVSKHWHLTTIPIMYHFLSVVCKCDFETFIEPRSRLVYDFGPNTIPTMDEARQFLQRNPFIARSVRQVRLAVVPTFMPRHSSAFAKFYVQRKSVIGFLSALPGIRDAVLEDVYISGQRRPPTANFTPFQLNSVYFDFNLLSMDASPNHFFNLASLFETPRSTFTISEFGPGADTAKIEAREYFPLDTQTHLRLVLRSSDRDSPFLKYIATLRGVDRVRRISLLFLGSRHLAGARDFLRRAGGGLQELMLHISSLYKMKGVDSVGLDLSGCQNLRRLQFKFKTRDKFVELLTGRMPMGWTFAYVVLEGLCASNGVNLDTLSFDLGILDKGKVPDTKKDLSGPLIRKVCAKVLQVLRQRKVRNVIVRLIGSSDEKWDTILGYYNTHMKEIIDTKKVELRVLIAKYEDSTGFPLSN